MKWKDRWWLTEPVKPAIVDEMAVHVKGVGAVVPVHHQVVHFLRWLPVPLPLVDEPVVDLLQVKPGRLSQCHLLSLLLTNVKS